MFFFLVGISPNLCEWAGVTGDGCGVPSVIQSIIY